MPTGTDLLTYIKDHYEKPFWVNSSHVNAVKKILQKNSGELTPAETKDFFACFEQTLIKNAQDANTKTLQLLEEILSSYFPGVTLSNIRWLQHNNLSTDENWTFILACAHKNRALGWLECLHDRYGINMQNPTLPQALRNALITHINAEEHNNQAIQAILITEITANIQSQSYTFFTHKSYFSPLIRSIIQGAKNPKSLVTLFLSSPEHWALLKERYGDTIIQVLAQCNSPEMPLLKNIRHFQEMNIACFYNISNHNLIGTMLNDPQLIDLDVHFVSNLLACRTTCMPIWELMSACPDRKTAQDVIRRLEKHYNLPIMSVPYDNSHFDLTRTQQQALQACILDNFTKNTPDDIYTWVETTIFHGVSPENIALLKWQNLFQPFWNNIIQTSNPNAAASYLLFLFEQSPKPNSYISSLHTIQTHTWEYFFQNPHPQLPQEFPLFFDLLMNLAANNFKRLKEYCDAPSLYGLLLDEVNNNKHLPFLDNEREEMIEYLRSRKILEKDIIDQVNYFCNSFSKMTSEQQELLNEMGFDETHIHQLKSTENPRKISDAVLKHWPELAKLTFSFSRTDLLKLLVIFESPADILTNNIVHLFNLHQNNFSKIEIGSWNAETLAIALKDPYFDQLQLHHLIIFSKHYCSTENWQLTQRYSSSADRYKILNCFDALEKEYGIKFSNPLRNPSSYIFELSCNDLDTLKQIIADKINQEQPIVQIIQQWILNNLFSDVPAELFTIARDAHVLGKLYHAHNRAQMGQCFSLLHDTDLLKQANITSMLVHLDAVDSTLNLIALTDILINLAKCNIISSTNHEADIERLAETEITSALFQDKYYQAIQQTMQYVDFNSVERVLIANNGKYWPLFESTSQLNILQRMTNWGIATNQNTHKLFSAPTSALDKLLLAETQPKPSEHPQLFFDFLLNPQPETSTLKRGTKYIHQQQSVIHSDKTFSPIDLQFHLEKRACDATQKFNERQKKTTSKIAPSEKKLSFFPTVTLHNFDVHAKTDVFEEQTTEYLHDKLSKKPGHLTGPSYKIMR